MRSMTMVLISFVLGGVAQEAELVDFSANAYSEPDFKFYDRQLLDNINRGDKDVQEFFRVLSLCHTVMPEEKNGKQINGR